MRRLLIFLFLLCSLSAWGQVSYWFQQFQRQGNAMYAQQYFATNGPGITFGFDGVRWVISANCSNILSYTNTWTGTNNFTGPLLWHGVQVCTNCASGFGILASADFAGQGPLDQVLHGGGPAGNPYWDYVDLDTEVRGNLAVGYLNFGIDADVNHYWRGDGTWGTLPSPAPPPAGLTTNICVVFCDATTNTLAFTNGILASITPGGPLHCASLILPGGGHLTTPLGYICLP
jgi:hypothetical protein